MLMKVFQRHKEWLITATSHLPRGPLAATDEQLEQFVDNITAESVQKPSVSCSSMLFPKFQALCFQNVALKGSPLSCADSVSEIPCKWT